MVEVPIWQPGDVAIFKYDPIARMLTMFHKRLGCSFSSGIIPAALVGASAHIYVAAKNGQNAVQVRVSQPTPADLQLFDA